VEKQTKEENKMRKYIAYIPAVTITIINLYLLNFGINVILPTTFVDRVIPTVFVYIILNWISGILLHKGFFWGGAFGSLTALSLIYQGALNEERAINADNLLGIALLIFYGIFGFYLWKKKDNAKTPTSDVIKFVVKIVLTIMVLILSIYILIISVMMIQDIHIAFAYIGTALVPFILMPLIWLKKRKKFLIISLVVATVYFMALGINYGIIKYDESITIDTSPNIDVYEYLPFKEDSMIVKTESKTLKLTENLPRIDGAAALFPVYSAFVNALYPETTKLNDGTFEYHNTPNGYRMLAEKKTDIFIGVYPSDEQKAYADECGTTFKYTPIGTEAFVFFVHKDNPIENLTTEQIQSIYAGEITNWKQVGGKDEKIAAFQRNEGSGSQSMLKRFMGDKPIMEAPKELVNDLMSGIIERVSDYRSKSNSIGFSFRYYVEGIIKNPDIKLLSVDGIAPTAENIRNGKYPIVTPIYAVTYEENTNDNVDRLLEWILSDEGQYIINETGYVGIN